MPAAPQLTGVDLVLTPDTVARMRTDDQRQFLRRAAKTTTSSESTSSSTTCRTKLTRKLVVSRSVQRRRSAARNGRLQPRHSTTRGSGGHGSCGRRRLVGDLPTRVCGSSDFATARDAQAIALGKLLGSCSASGPKNAAARVSQREILFRRLFAIDRHVPIVDFENHRRHRRAIQPSPPIGPRIPRRSTSCRSRDPSCPEPAPVGRAACCSIHPSTDRRSGEAPAWHSNCSTCCRSARSDADTRPPPPAPVPRASSPDTCGTTGPPTWWRARPPGTV